MTDIDEIFRASIDREEPEGVSTDDGGAVRAPPIDPREDDAFDISRLVAEWNEEREEPPTEDVSGSRLAGAREAIAEHIGSHPAETAQPPEPPPEVIAAAPEVTSDPESQPKLSRRDRRRAQREVDRLQRGASGGAVDAADETSDDVMILPPSEEVVAAAAAAGASAVTIADLPAPPAPAGSAVSDAQTTDPARVAPTPSAPESSDLAAPHPLPATAPESDDDDLPRMVRFPILTRSVLVWLFIFLIAGIAFGASAVFWWAHFNSEVDAIRTETSSFTGQVETAAGAIETQRTDALIEINTALDDLSRLTGATTAVITAGEHAESVWTMVTLDEDGVASVGSAFVVANEEDRSLLLTSLDSVRAATADPGPDITLHNGDQQLSADLWSWDEGRDLALLVVDDPSLPVLEWAGEDEAANALGSGVYALGGMGADGAAASPGLVIDQSTVGIQHTAPVGTAYRGGPIMSGEGLVLAIASTTYSPLGFDPGSILFAVPISAACESVLSCSIDKTPQAGEEGGPPLAGSAEPAGDDAAATPDDAVGSADGDTPPPDTE